MSVKVSIQDRTTSVLDFYLGIELNTTTLTSNAIVDSSVINVAAGHGIVSGNYLEMYDGLYFSQTEVKSVATNAITLDMPVDQPFTTSASIKIINIDLDIDGSSSNKIACFKPLGNNKYDITRTILEMTHAGAGDDGKFGDLGALTNGIYFRKTDGTHKNLFNAKTNGDLKIRTFDLTYAAKAGGGTFSTTVRRTFNSDDKNGVVIRLDPNFNDEIQAIIRDNLTALTTFRIVVQGHVFID